VIKLGREMKFLVKHRYLLFLVTITAWGAFLRLYKIDQLPVGLYPDVAANGLDALDILNGRFLPFYYRNGGREGVFFYIAAFFVSVLGNKPLALYLASSFLDIITLPVMYLFGKTFYNQKIALISTFFLASSFYHLNFSRFGYRAILLPLFLMLVLITLKKAFLTRKKKDWILAGACFGLGFYTYTAYLIFPFLLSVIWFIFRKNIKEINLKAKEKKYFLFSVLIILVSLLIYAGQHPKDVINRLYRANAFLDQSVSVHIFSGLINQVVATLKMFHIKGDPLILYNIAGKPILTFWEGAIFLTGLLWVLKNRQRPANLIILILFSGMLLPVMLSESAPHFIRALGIVPFLYTMTALGLDKIAAFLKQKTNKKLATLAVLIGLASTGFAGYRHYFQTWAGQKNLEKEFFADLVKMSDYVKKTSFDQPIYFLLASVRLSREGTGKATKDHNLQFLKSFLSQLAQAWDPDRPSELKIDQGEDYFWEGNTIKYLLFPIKPDYHVRHPRDLNNQEKGFYLFSNLRHSDFKDNLLSTFPQAALVEKNNYFEAWLTD